MKILLIKTSSLGDIIHAFPTLSFLRQKFPDAKIDWVVEKPFAELVKAHPFVNDVLTVDTKGWRKNLISKETWKTVQEARPAPLLRPCF
jgi:heptosyltransferase-1